MADKRLNIKVSTTGAKKAKSELGGVSGGLKSLGKQAIMAGGAFFAARGIMNGISAVIKLAGEQEQAEKRLSTALGRTSNALLNQASALQKVTTFGDEAIIGVQASLAAFLDSEDAIKKATEATLDISVAMGMDLKAAGDLVAKTLGSSMNAMSRYGVQVEGAVGSTERLESLTGNVARLFGGQAKAQAETMAGAMQQASNAMGDAGEKIGSLLAPAVTNIAEWFEKAAESVSGFIDVMTSGGAEITDTSDALSKAQINATRLRGEFKQLTDSLLYLTGKNELSNNELQRRDELIDDLQSKFPNYLGNLGEEGTDYLTIARSISDARKELEKYLEAQIKAATSKVFEEDIAETNAQIIKLQGRLEAIKDPTQLFFDAFKTEEQLIEDTKNEIAQLSIELEALTESYVEASKQAEAMTAVPPEDIPGGIPPDALTDLDEFIKLQMEKYDLLITEKALKDDFIALHQAEALALGLITKEQDKHLTFFESLGKHAKTSKEELIGYVETSEEWAKNLSSLAEAAGFESVYEALGMPEPDEIETLDEKFKNFIATKREEAAATEEQITLTAMLIAEDKALAKQLGLVKVQTDESTYSMQTFKDNINQATAASIQQAISITSTKDALKASGEAAKSVAIDIITAEIQIAVATWITNFLKETKGHPIITGVLALAGGAAFGSLMGSAIERNFAEGGIVPGQGNRDTVPAMLTPGEVILNQAQQENLAGGMGVTINISAPLVDETVVESIIPAIDRARRLNLA